jgi:hypothetical protein
VAGIGEDGCKLAAPSRINTLPKPFQAKAFVGIFAALFLGTQFFSSFLGDLTKQYEWFQSFRYTWPILGAVFVAAGVTHFTVEDEYCISILRKEPGESGTYREVPSFMCNGPESLKFLGAWVSSLGLGSRHWRDNRRLFPRLPFLSQFTCGSWSRIGFCCFAFSRDDCRDPSQHLHVHAWC